MMSKCQKVRLSQRVVHTALIFRSSIFHTIAVDTGESEPLDPEDIMDADALEVLLGGSTTCSTTTHSTDEHLTVDDPEGDIDLTHQPDLADAADAGSASAVVIDQFPFGRPGAPAHGSGQAPSAYDSQGSPWAPFQSQLDWDIARWAKRSGQTSTAVSELLAIPGVRALSFHLGVSNSIVIDR